MGRWFANALSQLAGSGTAGNAPNIDWLSDDIRIALVGAGYTPNLAADDFWNDVVANEISGTGYTANGAALGSKTLTVTAANSWATQWAASTAYAAGDIVRPTVANGYLYRATGAGTSAGSVKYACTSGDVAAIVLAGTPDTYYVEWQVTWASGSKPQTFPNDGYQIARVEAQLGS